MDIVEIQALINIRDYITRTINNYTINKKDIKDLQSMTILIDNKVIAMLLADDFKNYINFNDAKAAVAKAAENNNIKSSLKI